MCRPSHSIIPIPNQITVYGDHFSLFPTARIFAIQPELKGKAQYLACTLRRSTGFSFEIIENPSTPKTYQDIVLLVGSEWERLGPEGYCIVTPGGKPLEIRAARTEGISHGIQTLLQLLPPAIYNSGPHLGVAWVMQRVHIEDSPRFSWRGAMLDCGRHFMPKEFIKKFIDLLALHKLNTFHWHLTEDQGWRLQIKKYPRLTEFGSQRHETMRGHYNTGGDGIPHGGFYTQEDAREIVTYAAQRSITVLPEIEMPGHAQAAIASYPELGCTSEKLEVGTRWGVIPNIFNPSESTFHFLTDVLSEVLEIFPSIMIHIGGDEAVKTQWEASPEIRARMVEVGAKDMHELQSWFIRRIGAFLAQRGRRLVGWDEILEGGLAPNAVVMSWRGIAGGIAAVQAGHDVVMTPGSHTYLDSYECRDISAEPLAIGGFLPLEKVYEFEPIPAELDVEQAKHILGLQCQLWTEYMPNPARVEYRAFPRLAAIAEVGWSSSQVRNYARFRTRMVRHLQRLNVLDVRYRPLD